MGFGTGRRFATGRLPWHHWAHPSATRDKVFTFASVAYHISLISSRGVSPGGFAPWTPTRGPIRPSGLPSVGSGAGARAARKGRAAWQAGAVTRAAALQGVRCAAATLHTGPVTCVAAKRRASRVRCTVCLALTQEEQAPAKRRAAFPCAAQRHSSRAAPRNKLHSPKGNARFACAPCRPTALLQ